MKRFLGFLFAAFAVVLILASCRKVVHDTTTGIVDEVTDSMMVVKIDGSKVKFDITDCNFDNGSVMYGDSVFIHYFGDLSDKHVIAEHCSLIAKPSAVIEAVVDTTKELVTRTADNDAVKEFDKLMKAVKKQQKKK